MEIAREKPKSKMKQKVEGKRAKVQENVDPVPEAAENIDVAKELLHAALESSEEANSAAVDEGDSPVHPVVVEEVIPEEKGELKTDTYSKLLTENKKILCELSHLHLNEATTSKVKNITAFTEEQLAALYHNSELGMVEDFVVHFVEAELKGVAAKQHPLHELLNNYLHVREKIIGNTLEFNQLRKEYHECRSSLWTVERAAVVKQGQCQDGLKVTARHEFDKAMFHRSAFQTLIRILGNVQKLTNNNHVLYTFTAEDLKLQIELYLQTVISNCITVTQLHPKAAVSLTLEVEPSYLKPYLSELRLCISVLFSFQRYLIRDQQFIKETRDWLNRLVAILLRIANYQDHLFLLSHILRCPAGVGTWAASYIQTPFNKDAFESPFASYHINHIIAVLVAILTPIYKRDEFLESFSQSKDNPTEALWVIVDSDGEEDEETSGTSLKENDLVAIMNQLRLDDVFRATLLVQRRNYKDYYDHTQITEHHVLRFFAFATVLLKLFYRGLKTYQQPRYNQFAKRLSRFIRHVAQYATDQWEIFKNHQKLEDDAMLERLQVEYDAFFLRATYYLYSSQKLGAWQFLAVIPYHMVSKKTLWKLYYFLHDSDSSAENILISPDTENYEEKLWENAMRNQFEEKLGALSDAETYYLLNTFANMALAREICDMDFIEAATADLLQIGCISELTQETCSKSARILLTHITSKHPHLLNQILRIVKENISKITSYALYLYEELPLSIWVLQDEDIKIISNLLLDNAITTNESRLARMIISRLNWDFTSPGKLFLPYKMHVQIALLVSEAAQKEPGYMHWAWQTVFRLKLHLSDKGIASFEEVKELSCYDLINRGVREQQLLPTFLSILMTSWGHMVPLIYKHGLTQLQFLQSQQRHESVLFALHLIVPLFIDSQEILINSEQFQDIINHLINADRSYINMARSLVVSQNTLLEQFGHMIENHLVNYKWYNIESPRCLIRLWVNSIISLPNWNKDTGVLYLLDLIIRAAFFHADAFEAVHLIFKDLLQIATPTDSVGSVSSLFKWVAQGNQGRDCLVPGSLAKYSWLAYVILSAEFQEKELKTGFWKELLVQLKNQKGKVNVDTAIKKAANVVKVPSFSSSYLTIYRWAQQAMDAPVDHPLSPLLWQKFFFLYLARIPISGVSDFGCIGEKFFEGLINFSFMKKMKKRLQETVDYYKQKVESDEEDQSKKEINEKLLKLFKAYSLWLEEPRLQEINLHLPSLPLQYEPQLLALILHGDTSPWLEYVDYDLIKSEQQANIKAWRISIYREKNKVNQPLLNAGSNMESADPVERILRRLASYDAPRSPPEIKQVAPVTPRIDFGDKESMFKSLESCFAVIHQFAHNHHLRVSEYKSLDCTYQELLPQFYRSVLNKVVKQVPCRNRDEAVHCAGAARIILEMQEARVNDRVQHQIEINRSTYEDLLSKSWQAPALALCTASVTIQHAIKLLQNQIQCNPASAELGVELFYYILSLINDETTSYPPSRTLFAICLEKLGQSHIDGVEFEMPRLLETILKEPSLGCYLIPHFSPSSAGTANLLLMYSTIEQRLCEKRDVNFTLLSKFDIDKWLEEKKPKVIQRSEFIKIAVKALTTIGFEPQKELLMLHEVYRKHLLQVFEHQFPEHYGEVLMSLLKTSNGGTDSNCIAINVWMDILNAISKPVQIKLNLPLRDQLRQYAQHQRMLQHQELLDTTVLLARHFTQERLQYGLYGLYPKCRQYMEVFCLLIGMTGHGLIISSLNTHQGLLGDKLCERIWPYLRDMFAPWIIPYSIQNLKENMATWIQQLADDRSVLLPWIPADGPHAQKVINVLFECVQFLTHTLPASNTILSYIWQWYVTSFAHKSVKDHILNPIHTSLLLLPWQNYWPNVTDLDFMFKVIEQNLPECHVFLGHVFASVPWQPWISNLNENAPTQVKAKVHMCLLHLLVKLANEPYIRTNHIEKIKTLLVQAEQFSWNLIEPHVHQQIMDWYVMSCDSGVLLKNDPLNLDVRILEFLKVVSGYNRSYTSTSQMLLEKRRTYLRSYVKLIAVFSSRNKASLQSTEKDLNRALSAQLSHLEAIVQEEAELQILLTEFLAVLNLSQMNKINENCFTVWIKNRAGDSAILKAFLKVLTETCVNCDLTAVLLESCILAYFQNRGATSDKPSWKEIIEILVVCPRQLTELEHALVSRGCAMTLHAFLKQRALKSTDPINVMNIALTWLEGLKISDEAIETKVPLLWFDILTAAQKSCEIDEAAAASNLYKFSQILLQSAGEKGGSNWGRGLLGAIGIGKQQQTSLSFRFLNRALAGYVLAQLPDSRGLSQVVRQKENAPAIVGQSGGNTECVKVLLGLEFGQTQGKIKDCAELALRQIQDPINSLHNAKVFLATLIKQFYSNPYLKDE